MPKPWLKLTQDSNLLLEVLDHILLVGINPPGQADEQKLELAHHAGATANVQNIELARPTNLMTTCTIGKT